MLFIKKITFVLIIFFTTFSISQGNDQIAYLDLDNIVSNTKAGKLIINELKKSKKRLYQNLKKKKKN